MEANGSRRDGSELGNGFQPTLRHVATRGLAGLRSDLGRHDATRLEPDVSLSLMQDCLQGRPRQDHQVEGAELVPVGAHRTLPQTLLRRADGTASLRRETELLHRNITLPSSRLYRNIYGEAGLWPTSRCVPGPGSEGSGPLNFGLSVPDGRNGFGPHFRSVEYTRTRWLYPPLGVTVSRGSGLTLHHGGL